MKKIFYFSCLIFTIIIGSCKSHHTTVAAENAIADTTHFFPVVDYIMSDINDVKKIPYFIFKIRTINKKRDSTNITVIDFEKYVRPFLQFDITKQPLKSQLKESSFHDNSTKCNTLIYTPVNATIGDIRDVTVLLDEKTDKVKNIFIQTTRQIKDTTINENLQWKSRKSFRITTIKRAKDYYKEETNYVSWNDASN